MTIIRELVAKIDNLERLLDRLSAVETLSVDDSGNVGMAGAIEFDEMTAPGAGAANTARLYAVDNGAGKTQLAVVFNTGAVQILATQP